MQPQQLSTQDQMMLQSILEQLKMAPMQTPNPQANALIQQAIGQRPDALYLLVQMVAFKDAQLQQAQQHIMQMQQHMAQGQQNPAYQQQQYQQQQYPPQRQGGIGSLFGFGGRSAQQPYQQQMPYGQQNSGFGGSSFLGNVATTAVGVMAGSALFSGLGALFGGDEGGDSGGDDSSDEGGF